MIKNVQYNGLSFLNTPFWPSDWFLCLKEFSFFEVSTSASTEKYAIRHGEYVAPTLKKNRRIRMLFDIIASNEKQRRELLKKVQRAFSPEINPSPFNPNLWKKLTFEDVNDEVRTCKCQVIQGVELSDFANEKRVGISVELITNKSEFESLEVNTFEGRNTRRWKKFSFKTPFRNEFYREIIQYEGVVDVPLISRLEIVEENPLEINELNITTVRENQEQNFQIKPWDIEFFVGDVLTIDSDQRRVFLERNNIKTELTWFVTLGSNRPVLRCGENIVGVETGARRKKIKIDFSWSNQF